MTAATGQPARRRRWPYVLAVFAVLLAAGAWWVNRQLEPNRLTATVLARVGTSLGLELSIDGTPEYALRPEPRLLLPNLVVRQPGAADPLLTADRAEVSLPWDTITGGGSLVITRIELQRPALDLAALAAWQASRPAAPFELPTLTQGLRVDDGSVVGADWRLDALQLALPALRGGEPVSAETSGRFTQGITIVDFDAVASLGSAGLTSDFDFDGKGRLRRDALDVPWALEASGRLDASGDATQLDLASMVLASQSPLPDMDAQGRIVYGERLVANLAGTLESWPEDWPTLPAPMSAATSPLAYTLAYDGAPDFSAPLALTVRRDETSFDASFVLAEMTQWVDASGDTPLPPMVGTLSTPSLEVAGATLEGVRIQIEEDVPAEPEP